MKTLCLVAAFLLTGSVFAQTLPSSASQAATSSPTTGTASSTEGGTASSSAGIPATGKESASSFETLKKKQLDKISERIAKLQKVHSCMQAASNIEGLKACRPGHKK